MTTAPFSCKPAPLRNFLPALIGLVLLGGGPVGVIILFNLAPHWWIVEALFGMLLALIGWALVSSPAARLCTTAEESPLLTEEPLTVTVQE